MAVVLSELRTELDTDPEGLGYSPFVSSGNHTKLAELVNSITTTDISKSSVSNKDVINALDYSEVEALSTAKRETLTVLTQPDNIPVSSNTRNAFASVFGAGTNSRASLAALATKKATRAEVLFGVDTIVTTLHIHDALGL